jgi:G3E family GTPase
MGNTTGVDPRIPICLVTGFLGSGKTTFLKHVVSLHRERTLVYLVNEFSPQDIDGAIVAEENPNVVAIPGGSIFCRCLAGEFLGQFTSIPQRFEGVEGIVIEASGMANPKVIVDMLHEAKLDDQYVLAHIVSIVDPGSFMKLRVTLPNIIAQVEAADTLLVNKSDIHGAATVEETVSAVESINPHAQLHRCSHANVEIDLFTPVARDRELHGEYAKCRDPNYETYTLWPAAEINMDDLRNRVIAADDDLYRAKGCVASGGKTVAFDFDKSGFSFREEPAARESAVVLIMRNDPSPSGRALAEWLGAQR